MGTVNVEDWLEDWVDENLQSPAYQENKSAMASEAASCRQDAATDGLTDANLTGAAGGDLEAYLLRRQNVLTDAEVQRKVQSDNY